MEVKQQTSLWTAACTIASMDFFIYSVPWRPCLQVMQSLPTRSLAARAKPLQAATSAARPYLQRRLDVLQLWPKKHLPLRSTPGSVSIVASCCGLRLQSAPHSTSLFFSFCLVVVVLPFPRAAAPICYEIIPVSFSRLSLLLKFDG
jgi:hypothetical protein